jgi:hypothetical protein
MFRYSSLYFIFPNFFYKLLGYDLIDGIKIINLNEAQVPEF